MSKITASGFVKQILSQFRLSEEPDVKKTTRDNFKENSDELKGKLEEIKKKIESLEIQRLIEKDPDVSLKSFAENEYSLIESEKDLSKLAQEISKNHKIIAVDIEQTNINSYQGYNCLMQISTVSCDYIIDVIKLDKLIAKYLRAIFECESIIKVFYSGASDLQWLNRDYGIFVVNYFDLYNAALFLDKNKDSSLVSLINEYCNMNLDKSTKKIFQVSDWRIRPLTPEQLNYAMLDAHFLIYLRNVILEKLEKVKTAEMLSNFLVKMQSGCLKTYETKPLNLSSVAQQFDNEMSVYKKLYKNEPERLQHIDKVKAKEIFLKLSQLRDQLARQIDTNLEMVASTKFLFMFSISPPLNFTTTEIADKILSLTEGPGVLPAYLYHIVRAVQDSNEVKENLQNPKNEVNLDAKEEQRLFRRKRHEEKFTLKKRLYENCRVLAPDGELLSYTNRKKVNWYLSKNMAVLVGEDPPIIKLKFEPSGRGTLELSDLKIDREEYMCHNRENQCVICGQQDTLSRYHVVPGLYRQHFPEKLKNHRAFDVLLMCFRCREKANAEADKFKVELSKRFDVPLIEFNKPQQIKLAAEGIQKVLSTYTKFKDTMPKDRRKKIKEDIRNNFAVINDPTLHEEIQREFEKFDYKENGQVKINEKFFKFFSNVTNFRGLAQKNSNKDFKNMHGRLVVEKFNTIEEIKAFIDEWRAYFISTMNPAFLPHDWNLALREKAKLKNQEADARLE